MGGTSVPMLFARIAAIRAKSIGTEVPPTQQERGAGATGPIRAPASAGLSLLPDRARLHSPYASITASCRDTSAPACSASCGQLNGCSQPAVSSCRRRSTSAGADCGGVARKKYTPGSASSSPVLGSRTR
ncbi:DUF6053 domain-containing protein [Lysobacter enzymogenes]|uniref:DUF6053 domain-containing protein n=1 Tax=Lysobacter enzymogenes TaxID=69 RepID=UPI003D18DF7B